MTGALRPRASPPARTLAAGLLATVAGFGPADGMQHGGSHRSAGCPDPDSLVAGRGQPFAAVRYLADDALEGRLAGSRGARCAADYIAARFRRLGLEPAGADGSFFHPVSLDAAANPHLPGGTGRNVVARLPGSDPARAGEAVVVGAHYDHLGRGPFGSLRPGDRSVHNGADDNASGVAALLLAAERLRDAPPPRSVVFVAFTAEELGLVGSSAYVHAPVVPLDRTVAMLNLDMVGRLGDGPLIVSGTGSAEEWPSIVSRAAGRVGIEVAVDSSGYGPSDHTSFYGRDVPVLHLFTNVHEDYHRPSDDWGRVDLAGLARIGELTAGLVRSVAGRHGRLTLMRGVGSPPTAAGDGDGYGAWLGTVPDFAPVARGVRLAGVTGGSPAERAGLRSGDVIVGLGGHEVSDLYDMTRALRAHVPGDTVTVRVLRDGSEVELTAVLGDRSDRS